MSLSAAIKRFQANLPPATEKEFRQIVLAVANQAIRNTPVDTGRLRGNWQIGFNEYPSGTPYRVGEVRTGSEQRAETASLRRVARKANKGLRTQSRYAYIANNLPYATAVESGGPTNRPRRMLARAVLAASKGLFVGPMKP